MVIVDSNIIIDYLRRKDKSPLESFFEQRNEKLCISLISVQELFAGRSTLDKKEEDFLLALLISLTILPYNFEVAKFAGELMRDTKQPLAFPDAAIAATAILNDAKLFTLNKKDFENIPKLQLI